MVLFHYTSRIKRIEKYYIHKGIKQYQNDIIGM